METLQPATLLMDITTKTAHLLDLTTANGLNVWSGSLVATTHAAIEFKHFLTLTGIFAVIIAAFRAFP